MSGPGATPAQLSLHCGALSLDLTSAGGACTALRWQVPGADAFNVLQPRAAQSEERFEQPSYALVPYSNRLFDGQLITPTGPITLPGNHRLHPIPIHGVAWRTDWQTHQTGEASATLHYRHTADAHWPFAHECTQQVSLGPDTAHFALTLRNLSDQPMPAGLGFHPWFAVDEDSTVDFTAASVWTQDAQGRPLAAVPAGNEARFDFARPRPAMDVVQDHCHVNWHGPARLTHPRRQLAVELTASADLSHLMVYRRPGQAWLCLEPVSHATGALSLPALNTAACGARLLAPGASWSAWMTLAIHRLG